MATDSPQSDQRFIAPILGRDTQALLITLNQRLSNLGIDGTIKLPSIAVLGDQSTSKSSLIKAISNVDLPTGSGTCTRCPISISLSSGRPMAGEWQCSVYIDERYYYDNSVRQRRVSIRNPLGPWKLREEPIITLIETTQDRGRLLDIIQRAQTQILNIHKDGAFSRSTSTNDLEKFSPNVIKIEITVKDCPELSFIDLPGVIANSDTDYHVALVKALAGSYVRDENNILCLCLPVNHDVSNSNSFSIVRNEGGQSHTMAIFTKVDIARPEERDDCLRTYFGQGNSQDEEEEFEYGHHIVMLKDTSGSGQTVTEAEDGFFSQSPWSSLSTSVKECLGVINLIDRIRKILFQKTAETLPENLELLTARIRNIQDELKEMPEPPDTRELPYALGKHMFVFENNMRQLFSQTGEGESPRNTLIQCMQRFSEKMKMARPKVKVKTASEKKAQDKALATLGSVAGADQHTVDACHTFSLEGIRQLNDYHYSSSIPGDIELKAVVEMHRLAVQPWDKLFANFIGEVEKAIKLEVLRCVDNTFKSIIHLPAYERIQAITEHYLDHVIGKECSLLFNLCASERTHPLTFNDASMRAAEADSLTYLRDQRVRARLCVLKLIRKAEADGKRIRDPTATELEQDEYDLEIRMAAKTRGYFEIASHRFVDTVCLNIHAQLIPRCEAAVASHVKDMLGLNSIKENEANIVALMTEDGEREALRRRKLSELERLETGYNYISNVLDTLQRQSAGLPQSTDPDAHSTFYENLRDDPFAFRNDLSPNKRKLDDTELGNDAEPVSTPSKRPRESGKQPAYQSNGGPSNTRSHLPSRPRSMDPDEQQI